MSDETKPTHLYHRFLDEAGDTTFYGKGKVSVVGQQAGVSLCFILGMVKFATPLQPIREAVVRLQKQVEADPYYRDVCSIVKKKAKGGFYFHATDDVPEVRKVFFEFIQSVDCSFEAVVGRKIPALYETKHNGNESEFYADLLSHLLKNKLQSDDKLVLNVAERGKSTRNENLMKALAKAAGRFQKKKPDVGVKTQVVFNVQNHHTEPLLNVTDYLCWAVQRVFERGEVRYYDFIRDKISLVVDLYDTANYPGSRNYYRRGNWLTAGNKLGPPAP